MNRLATVVIDPAYRVAPVPPRLFGSFVEHMGRCVYGGIHEPDHPSADPDGFRGDVGELVRELGVTLVRYPGGNFVSGYHWEDGIGPIDRRPTRLDLAWKAIETNRVGIDEFVRWVNGVGCEPMVAVNLGTRGIDAACNLLEYANHPGGTTWSDLRIEHGAALPYGIRVWCLGNEMDGPWQIGHKTAHEYGRLAAEVARAMRRVDPAIELVACGSSNSSMPTFGAWEAEVLEQCHDLVDFVSLHAYYEQHGDDRSSFLASAVDMDHMIERVIATSDAVATRLRSPRRLALAFDEWNVWYQQRHDDGALAFDRAPALIEDDYTVTDAVVVGSLLVSLLRHADRVHIACLAQLVNVIAPIRTEPGGAAWRQSIFHPFAATARHARGDVLAAAVDSPVHRTERFGDVATLDAVATLDDATGDVTAILVNRSAVHALDVEIVLRGLPGAEVRERLQVRDDDPDATNSASAPNRVGATAGEPVRRTDDGGIALSVAPASWTMLRLSTGGRA